MSCDSRFAAVFLAHFAVAFPALSQETQKSAEPITLANVKMVGLLSETRRAARYIKLGPGPNELLLYPPNGIVAVNSKNLQVLRRIDEEKTRRFSFSKDRNLTSWSKGKKVMIHDEKADTVLEIDAGQEPGTAVFSPDSQVVAIGEMIVTGAEGDGHSLLRIFDTTSGDLIQTLESSASGYGHLTPVFSPDGKILAVGNRNHETKLFDTETWTLQHTLPKRMTHEIAFSPDGNSLATGYVDGMLGLWDVESGTALHMVKSGCSEIHSLDWNASGDLLATSGPAGTQHGPGNTWIRLPGKVLLWNARTFEVANELMQVQWSGSVRFIRGDTQLIATIRKRRTLDDSLGIAIWSTKAPAASETVRRKANAPVIPVERSLILPGVSPPRVAVDPAGQRLVLPLESSYQIALLNLSTGKREFIFSGEHGWQISRVAFSPDGATVATASLDKTAMLWDSKSGELLAKLEGHPDRLDDVVFSPSGKLVVTSTGKRWPYSPQGNVTIRIWDASTGTLIAEFNKHRDTIGDARFDRTEARVLTSSDDHTARLWEAASGKELYTFDHGSGIRSIAFSPDGKTILTSSRGTQSNYVKGGGDIPAPSVKLWDAMSGNQLLHKTLPQAVQASFNESGDQFLTECRGQVTYWDTASGTKRKTLREPLIGAEVSFCPNGKFFVVQSPGEPLELWSIANQEFIARMVFDEPSRSFFSPDSRTFYSLSRSGEFSSWSLAGLK